MPSAWFTLMMTLWFPSGWACVCLPSNSQKSAPAWLVTCSKTSSVLRKCSAMPEDGGGVCLLAPFPARLQHFLCSKLEGEFLAQESDALESRK